MQVKAREQKEDKKLREQREEKEELARRVASLEMASIEVLIMMMMMRPLWNWLGGFDYGADDEEASLETAGVEVMIMVTMVRIKVVALEMAKPLRFSP